MRGCEGAYNFNEIDLWAWGLFAIFRASEPVVLAQWMVGWFGCNAIDGAPVDGIYSEVA